MLVIHRINKDNTGDMAACPLQYWDMPHSSLNLDDPKFNDKIQTCNETIIIGGGGLLNFCPDWNDRINYALKYATEKGESKSMGGVWAIIGISDNTDLPILELYRFTSLGYDRGGIPFCSMCFLYVRSDSI